MNRIRVVPRKGLEKNSRFILALQLSRLINTIQANKRHYLRIKDEEDPTILRDRLELILYHGAIIFEAIQTVLKFSEELSKLEPWSSNSHLVKRIQVEANEQRSFTNKYLKPLRNKIVFHYDIEAIDTISSCFALTENTPFAESKTERDSDLAFVLADEMLFSYVISKIDERVNDDERWEYFQEELLEVSDILVKMLLFLTVELAKNFSVIEESGE